MTVATAQRKSLEPFLKDSVEYYQHQVDGVRWAARHRNFLLADEMGLGKSLQALTVFAIDVKIGKGDTLLVVCPVTLRRNWADEIEKFTGMSYTLFGQAPHPSKPTKLKTLTKLERMEQLRAFKLAEGPKVLIANYEQIVAHVGEMTGYFHMVIFDEAHSIKNPEAQRTKASHRLKPARNAMLTGTPVLNRVDELWSLLHLIDPLRFNNYKRFRNRYCVFGGYGGKQIVGAKNTSELNKILADVMIRRLKKDHLTLPEPNIMQVKVDLHPEQEKLYDSVAEELLLPDENGDPQEIKNAMVKVLRLKQICGSPAAVGGDDNSYKLDLAVDRALEVLDSGERLVVFTQFIPILELFADRMAKVWDDDAIFRLSGPRVPKDRRTEYVKHWGSYHKPSLLVCMFQVAGVGLNMTQARTAFRLDKLFVPGLNQQAIDRLHRIGQQEVQPIEVYDFITRNTYEEKIEQINRSKNKVIDSVVEDSAAFAKLLGDLRKMVART